MEAPAIEISREVPESSRDRWPILLGFLVGRRASILAIARDPRLVCVGLLLVLSAGLAREYDGEDLTTQPWHALVPVAVSLPMSLALWALLYASGRRRAGPALRFWRYFLAFLTLYWMTAPLAWLYGIPYER